MSDQDVCVCGDVRDEHGHDTRHPGSTACCCGGCPCIAFELDRDAVEDDAGEP